MKLLIDMNLSPRWAITFLSATAADHWSTIGRHDATDAEIMAYAREHGYVVVTSDLDFSAMLAASGAEGPSVVQIRADNLDPSVIGREVLVARGSIGARRVGVDRPGPAHACARAAAAGRLMDPRSSCRA